MAGQREAQSVPWFADERPAEVIADGVRLDGRSLEEFRNVFLKTGVISQASGSAYAEFGHTKVMVGVYGPRQSERRVEYSEQGRINVDVKLASFATRQRGIFGQSPEERELSAGVQAALEAAADLASFPKASADVYVLVLEAGGGELGVAATAAALALADAGIELFDIVVACSVSRVDGCLLLDPSTDESFREQGGLVLALLPTSNEVTQLVSRGRWSGSQLREGLELAMGGCAQLESAARQCLKDAAVAAAAKQRHRCS
ncbi:hypothetical protein D9Q98_002687 [Chlorella vulgaris]|uniref:Uncharacterized protein n=1 Tax=Chlorella vulgaris TaxID=3077 RepID=A0A9D4YZY8_CHLVU|nr:hypothetical protein D9Q98_002687 [Chlorella vulgaris]